MEQMARLKSLHIAEKNRQNQIGEHSLMMEAGKVLYDNYAWHGKIGIIAGKGNNAGDGYVLAKLLEDQYDVHILNVYEGIFSPMGLYFYEQTKALKEKIDENYDFSSYDILVDGLFGIGFHGKMDERIIKLIKKINEASKEVVSIDINSGLNADNGLAAIAIKSTLTISLGGLKPGLLLNDAKDYVGKIINCDLGFNISDELFHFTIKDAKNILPERPKTAHKGAFGYVGIMGGSKYYSGSIKLSTLALAALRGGAGVARILCPKTVLESINPYILEATIFPLDDYDGQIVFNPFQLEKALDKLKALAVGMGMGQSSENKIIFDYLLEKKDLPLVIDADGLNSLDEKQLQIEKGIVILTPHLKEFSRLTKKPIDEIKENILDYAIQFSKENKVILLLKGPTTIITDGKITYLVDEGTPGMATAGSGDILSGLLVGLLGYLEPNVETIALGAFINGLAGRLGEDQNPISMIARDTIINIKEAIKEIIKR